MNREQVSALIGDAMARVVRDDLQLLDLNVCERALQFRLAHYIALSPLIAPPLTVDCEYNRHLRNQKKLLLPTRDEESKVFPDILIHQRDSDDHNELVLELKRLGQPLGPDREKLETFVNQLGYRHAAQVVMGLDHIRGPIAEIRWI